MEEKINELEEKLKKEKKKKAVLIVIILLLLIYIWYCFTYHMGYIRKTVDGEHKDNTVTTDAEIVLKEDKDDSTETNGSKETEQQIYKQQNKGPYKIKDENKNEKEENSKVEVENEKNDVNIEEKDNEEETEKEEPPKYSQETIDKVKLFQETEDFNELNNLDIFKYSDYYNEKLIYPGLSGIYYFKIENASNEDVMYKLSIIEDNSHNVNMKFKLKRNGTFIAGNEDKYVSVSELIKKGLNLNSGEGDNYILYWKWEDSDHDAQSTDYYVRGDYKITIKGELQ